jgi:hypothetical protein
MTTDYRALCAELAEILAEEYGVETEYENGDPLEGGVLDVLARARTALAQPEPPAVGEVAELVAVLRADAECITAEQPELMQVTDNQLNRVADLLDCLSQSRLSGSGEEKREALKERLWHRYRTSSHRGGLFIPDCDFDSVFNEACALAQPEPVGVTDEELLFWASTYGIDYVDPDHPSEIDHQRAPVTSAELRCFARAVLTRYSHPTLTPIPMSERLPMAEDCDAEGRCWFSSRLNADGRWNLEDRTSGLNGRWYTHWLPATALPLPRQPAPDA